MARGSRRYTQGRREEVEGSHKDCARKPKVHTRMARGSRRITQGLSEKDDTDEEIAAENTHVVARVNSGVVRGSRVYFVWAWADRCETSEESTSLTRARIKDTEEHRKSLRVISHVSTQIEG